MSRIGTAPDLDRRPRPAGDRADPRPRRVVRRGLRPRDQEGPGAARAHGRQPLLRGEHAHQLVLRARGQAAQRRRGQHPLGRLERRQGRVAQGHRPDAVGLRPGGDRDPLAARRRGAARRRLDARGGDQRRRRQARAPDAGAARRVHAAPPARLARRRADLDRRRRAALARGALEHPRAPADGRERHRVRAADADPARDRGARVRGGGRRSTASSEADVVYVLRMQQERMHDSFVPSLREYAARYQINAARLQPGPAADAPRAGQPRGRALGRRDRLARRR